MGIFCFVEVKSQVEVLWHGHMDNMVVFTKNLCKIKVGSRNLNVALDFMDFDLCNVAWDASKQCELQAGNSHSLQEMDGW